ncbi:hypothetical protein BC831DRAFT_449942 [Entophlyctis helioformis]|nr:hypothetical protein BC831DRAFT_449942 [Entophlyctis helioformis]
MSVGGLAFSGCGPMGCSRKYSQADALSWIAATVDCGATRVVILPWYLTFCVSVSSMGVDVCRWDAHGGLAILSSCVCILIAAFNAR